MYQFLQLIGAPIIYLLFLPRVIGKKNTKIKGKAVIVSNHLSMWDPLFISIMFRRQIYWMGKIELFKNKFLKVFFSLVKSFPVRRGEGDLPAIRHAFNILRSDKLLGIFPEGTRAKGGGLRNFEPGTSMIALKNKAPVIPIYIKGNYKIFHRMTMIIGEPIQLSDYVGSSTNTHTVKIASEFLENKLKDMMESKFKI
jgi:1-acyl-sn-glycerol-3-phosphate acyltransferase